MKHTVTKALSVVAIFVAMSLGTFVLAETVDTRIGKLDFELGVPTKETVAKLYDELDFQRACQLYLWALPTVDTVQLRLYSTFVSGSRDADGGLTLYIQHESPGKDKESNWLPAPNGTFIMVMRIYWPKPEVLDGRWKAPPLERVK